IGCSSAMASSYLPCCESLRAAAKSESAAGAFFASEAGAGVEAAGGWAGSQVLPAKRKTGSHLAVDICMRLSEALDKIRTQRKTSGSGLGLEFWFSKLVSDDRRFRHADVFVRAAVIEQVAVASSDHALDKDDIRYLTDFFPFLFGREDGLLAAVKYFARVLAVENCDCGAVNEFVVSAVVEQHNPVGRQDWRWSGLDHARVELSRPARQYGRLGRFGPVNEVGRISQPHLVVLVGSG